MIKRGHMQIGKYGLTESFMISLKNRFKTHENIKIFVLKSAEHDRKKIKEISEKIIDFLGKNYTSKIVGFTISIKKWRKARR